MKRLDTKRWNLTIDNLANAFPTLGSSEVNSIARGAYKNLGEMLVETIALKSMSKLDLERDMQIDGIHELAYRAKYRQASILLSGHYGNWEYLALRAGIAMKAPVSVVTHNMKNQRMNTALNARRVQFGNRVVSMHNSAKELVRAMREGGSVAFLVDQFADADKNPQTVFFNQPTPTYGAPAQLALRFNIPIYYAFAVRTAPGSYHANLLKIESEGIENDAVGVQRLTQMHVDVLESAIREHPDHWSWQHRRWRPNETGYTL